MKYKEIHIWEFPSTRTYIRLDDSFRKELFDRIMNIIGFGKTAMILNKASRLYKIERKYNHGHLSVWKTGFKKNRGKINSVNIPLWVLIEISKLLAKTGRVDNDLMKDIEKNTVSYSGSGKSNSVKSPKLPLLMTPELISIVFHLCGDGYIGKGSAVSHYRQMNKEGLNNFINKMKNIFGDFEFNKKEIYNGRLNIPRAISDFYNNYFSLDYSRWNTSRIPENIKSLPKDFLLAGLNAFIIDEGHIGDVIEIYSKNYNLLNDIRDVAIRLGYYCFPIKKKIKYREFDQYRFLISLEASERFYNDIRSLMNIFPTCGLAQKSKNLEIIVKRRKRGWLYRSNGITKGMIIKLLENEKSVKELASQLCIGLSSLREHLRELEKERKIKRIRKIKHAVLWKKIK